MIVKKTENEELSNLTSKNLIMKRNRIIKRDLLQSNSDREFC
jgi:hypothetical protein